MDGNERLAFDAYRGKDFTTLLDQVSDPWNRLAQNEATTFLAFKRSSMRIKVYGKAKRLKGQNCDRPM